MIGIMLDGDVVPVGSFLEGKILWSADGGQTPEKFAAAIEFGIDTGSPAPLLTKSFDS